MKKYNVIFNGEATQYAAGEKVCIDVTDFEKENDVKYFCLDDKKTPYYYRYDGKCVYFNFEMPAHDITVRYHQKSWAEAK